MFVEAKFFHKAGEGSGGGGGDSHNKGSFLTPEALRTAYPTAEPGDFAIVESTDTVWVWDNDGSDWKDGDTKGQVTSVNNQTGDVVIPNELPQMSYNTRGKYLKNVWGASGGEAVWSDELLLVNCSSNPVWSVAAGSNSQASSQNAAVYGVDAKGNKYDVTVVGCETEATANSAVILGYKAKSTAFAAIQLGSRGTNSEIGTLCVSLYYNNVFVNYKLLDSDGTIPTDRFTTTPVADGTYVPTLTISSGTATRSWAAPGGGSTAATGTLVAANWSSSSQTINVIGVTASNNVIVAPAPASQSAYTTAGVICTGQSTNSLTFTCNTTPSSDIVVTVLIV